MESSNKQHKYSAKHIDKFRDVYVDTNAWSCLVESEFADRMSALGIEVDKIYWSGFCSQGDGACFSGQIKDWGLYLAHLGYTDPILIDCATHNWSFRWEHRGHYFHHKSVVYDEGVYLPDNPYTVVYGRTPPEEDHFRGAVWDASMERHDLLELTEQIKEDLEDHMKDLYKRLEVEYEHLTSDESIAEWMEANEIDPDELTHQE